MAELIIAGILFVGFDLIIKQLRRIADALEKQNQVETKRMVRPSKRIDNQRAF